MKLEIRLFAGLKCNNGDLPCLGKNEFGLEVPEGTTVEALYKVLKIETRHPLVNLINGRSRPGEWVLSDNDRVGLFPPIGGG